MGPYERSGVHLSFGILATTMMYCEDTMELESEFLGALGAVKGWRRVDRGLELSDGEGEVLARFEPEDTADPPDPATPPSSGGA
jgi:heat shock protein HslJ